MLVHRTPAVVIHKNQAAIPAQHPAQPNINGLTAQPRLTLIAPDLHPDKRAFNKIHHIKNHRLTLGCG